MKNVLSFSFERTKLFPGFDGVECKICPSVIQTEKAVFLTYSMLLLSGSDVVNDHYVAKSTDGGKSFCTPEVLERLETRKDGVRTIFSGCSEFYSKFHKRWFSIGLKTSYADDKEPICVGGISVCTPHYIFRNTQSGHYEGELRSIPMPFSCTSVVPHGQVIEYENGEFLLSFYVVLEGEIKASGLTVRYRYENDALTIVGAGTPIAAPSSKRGVCEPSVASLFGRYYATLRTDEQGLLAVSEDGFHFSEPMPWRWDDGSILENYNTMQRWIRHRDGLFLAYTRRGAHNDHVFRHRAPLFMARFDEEKLCLIKDTEVILVPELGARLGNFCVTEMAEDEIWLSTAEWMQTWGNKVGVCEKYGSDNSLWIAKIRFD